MPVIAMSREMASLGKAVAIGLAQDLGLKLLEHELVESKHGQRPRGTSLVSKFTMPKPNSLARWGKRENTGGLYTAEEIFDAATDGNVLIRGWGGHYLLRDISHVIRLRVCAPMDFRINVLMERLAISDRRRARKAIESSDATHARVMHALFNVDCRDPLLYHLVVNSEEVAVADAVELIKHLSARPAFQETDRSRLLLADHRLQAHVSAALQSDPSTRQIALQLGVHLEPGTGNIAISGVVTSEQQKRDAEMVVRSVVGVAQVVNNLNIEPSYLSP